MTIDELSNKSTVLPYKSKIYLIKYVKFYVNLRFNFQKSTDVDIL